MSERRSEVGAVLRFPNVAARDLEGRAHSLPRDFSGTANLVVIAFRREQQRAVDSWIAWFESVAVEHVGLRCYEVPVLATRWSPARAFIDGGMASAVQDPEARRRTLTVYTDVRRVTDALVIDDTGAVTVLLVGSDGRVWWRATGPATEQAGTELRRALGAGDAGIVGAGEEAPVEQFEFEFDPRFRPVLAAVGVTPGTAHVTLTPDRLVARFGPWTFDTPVGNVREACRTGPYRWFKAIGPRWSFADHGLTFGTTTRGGVCVLLREPVPGLTPLHAVRHPGITLTLAEPDRFVTAVLRRVRRQ